MKKFAGFTPDQQYTLLQKMGYTGPKREQEMAQFMSSNPEAQSRMGKLAETAQRRISGTVQNEVKKFAEGGVVAGSQAALDAAKARLASAQAAQTGGNKREVRAQRDQLASAQAAFDGAQQAFSLTNTQTAPEQIAAAQNQTQQSVQNPTQFVTPGNVAQTPVTNEQFIAQGTGQVGPAATGQVSTVGDTQQAATPENITASTVDPTRVTEAVRDELSNLQAAQADPTKRATVRGQLEELMADFEGGGTPPWASGAMRQAMSLMQSRGMGASSMAGQAVVQAAMESALGIASQDAQTYAQFEMQNLNNRQQTAIFKTQTMIGAMLSDQGAENAAKQFNASSENQVKQFMADLQSTVSRFNADQVNAIRRFNAGEENAMSQFNAQVQNQRDQFNAANDLVIAQANTRWRQEIATADTLAQNAANMEAARNANALTQRAMEQIWQKERDLMAFAFQSAENAEQRKQELLLQGKSIKAQNDAATKQGIGYLAGRLLFG
jgi:predicted transcriptional regulator